MKIDTFSDQLTSVVLGLAFLAMPVAAGPAHPLLSDVDPVGHWQGTLDVGGQSLRLVFHIAQGEGGALTATMDSPDQGAQGIPAGPVTVSGDSLRIEVPAVGGVYEGVFSEGGDAVEGTWKQGGFALPLALRRTEDDGRPKRPQEPAPPYPYVSEDVAYPNPEADLTLAGTLTYPEEGGPFPAVILISGSGPQNRDEELMGHKPFLVLADHLTRHGIAVLRFDDRGVGASTGDFAAATTADFAGDVRAGLAYLKTRGDVADPDRLGLVGHSEGGLVAPMVAAASPDVGFVVLLAGPGVTGEEILYAQSELINRAMGTSEADLAGNRALQEALFEVIREEADDSVRTARIRTLLREQMAGMDEQERARHGLTEQTVEVQVQQLSTPWFRYFLTYDPRPALEALGVPVLALFGEKDLQVPPEQNAAAVEAALNASAATQFVVEVLPGLNHLFQAAGSGAPMEYGRIEETINPAALDRITTWILER